MPIEIHCDNCGKLYEAAEHMVGKRIKCRQCSHVFTIPAPEVDDPKDSLNALAKMEETPGITREQGLWSPAELKAKWPEIGK